jgi:DNA polymerase I
VSRPVAVVVARDAVAWADQQGGGHSADVSGTLHDLAAAEPRWVWWSARETAPALLDAGVVPRGCWDLAAVGRVLHGGRREDVGAVWAEAHGLPVPAPVHAETGLLELDPPGDEPIDDDGGLRPSWLRGAWAEDAGRMRAWAAAAQRTFQAQQAAITALPDPRATPREPSLALLTAYAESIAALLAVELERDGLPIDTAVVTELVTTAAGPRPVDERHAQAQRRQRDAAVVEQFPGGPVDLRNPAQVRELLARIGLDLPDTRSWRLEPHAASLPPVAALLAWRKTERLLTTYGWSWLDRNVGADGRLRGTWTASEGAGRMSAGAGLHNMPAELRPAVRAEPGHVLVRADLGQVEPRVLAVVSGDPGLAEAAGAADMYAPVAAALRSDRPTAKVAVLAAMYGQTSGTAGAALRDMERAYPRALAYLRAAEEAGRIGTDLRTYGGRLLRLSRIRTEDGELDDRYPPSAWGRFARNAVVQGAAAELFKAWAGTVRAGLRALDGQIVLCLHDELLLHVPESAAGDAEQLLHTALAGTAAWWAAGSGVRFVADVATGESWAAAH